MADWKNVRSAVRCQPFADRIALANAVDPVDIAVGDEYRISA